MSERSVYFVEFRRRGNRKLKWQLIRGATFFTKSEAVAHKRVCDECDGAEDVHRVVEYRRVEQPTSEREQS